MPSEDLKPVKKHDDDDTSSTFKKVANSNAKPNSKLPKLKKEPETVPISTSASRSKKTQVKKELKDHDSDEDDDDDKPIARKISSSMDLIPFGLESFSPKFNFLYKA